MPENSEVKQPQQLDRKDIKSILIGVMLAMFVASLDQTIIATAMPTIGADLHDFEHLPWVVTIYLLTSTAVTPLYGKFADIKGRRITMLVALVTFVAASILCAVANSMFMLILARGLQGLGGGGLISIAQTIIGDVIPPPERGRYQAYFAIVFASSSLLGPVLGGFFAEYLHWTMIFWINIPLGAIAFFITNTRLKRLPRHDKPRSLDFLGAITMMVATILLLLTLNWGGIRYAWLSFEIQALIGSSLVLWLLFAARLKFAHEPLIPPEVLNNKVVRMGVLSACCGVGTYIGLSIYLPIFFEVDRGFSASHSGLALIPLMIGSVFGAQLSGRTMTKRVHYKRISLIGLCFSMAGSLLLAFYASDINFIALEIVLALMSMGLGTLFPVSTVAIQNAVPLHQLGTATATGNFFRSLGGALIVALFGAIILGGSKASSGTTLENLAGALAGNREALTQSFSFIFAAAFVGFALSFLFLLIMEEKPLINRTQVHPPAMPE
ncbi:MDR family MFS transporter [Microvirga sp. W0021]|uniref:MDR family MFS transporter n=1 Tax=Hohaiivirga grylli TaxID=3133970 RepID=A0ABV0BGF9_9HYPH